MATDAEPLHGGLSEARVPRRRDARDLDEDLCLLLVVHLAERGSKLGGRRVDLDRALHLTRNHCVELGPREGMERRHAAQFEPSRGLLAIGELLLHLAGKPQRGLHRALVDRIAETVLLALGQQALGDGAIEIVAAQSGVAARRQHLEHALLQAQQREVEGAPAQVVDGVKPFRALIETVGKRRGGRLINEPQHFETGHARMS